MTALGSYEARERDVIVIGGGGAGSRAAIEAAAQGVSVGLICKSLLGKAHTVMAEGGIAAALGNVYPAWRQDAEQLADGPAARQVRERAACAAAWVHIGNPGLKP